MTTDTGERYLRTLFSTVENASLPCVVAIKFLGHLKVCPESKILLCAAQTPSYDTNAKEIEHRRNR